LGDENMVTIHFNEKLVKNIYRRFCSSDVNSEKQKWFDYGSLKISGHVIFCYDSILPTRFYTYCSLCNREQ